MVTLANKTLNILEFISELSLLGDITLSLAQRAILKSVYGLPLDPDELEIFKRATGRDLYLPREQSELSLLAGRQGGKSLTSALIATYESFRQHGVPRGQRGYVLIVAPVMDQASVTFNYISQFILSTPTLAQYVLRRRRNVIELRNGVVIACKPCSSGTIRGYPIICAVLEEMGFWRHDDNSANPERAVLKAIRPAMATLRNTKLLKISTPHLKEGILYFESQRRADLNHYFWQLGSGEMNPKISNEFLDHAQKFDDESFRREHMAEFIDSNRAWIAPEMLEMCVTHGHQDLPAVSGGAYVAAVDPAFQKSDFGFALLHRSDCGQISVACARRWTGSKAVPLNFDFVAHEIHQKLQHTG